MKILDMNWKIFFLFFICLFLINTQQQSESQQIDKQTQHIQQFARTMADFAATQTFTFDLAAAEQQNFILWPGPEIQKIRGIFYLDHRMQDMQVSGQGLFVGCQVNGVIQKTFINQRLGVFTIIPKSQPSNIKIIVKSDIQPLSVYFSYELCKKKQKTDPQSQNQNVPTKQQEQQKQNESKLTQVTEKFKKVQITVEGQEQSLRMILKHINKHGRKLQGDLKHAHTRILIQTVIVLLSGLIGMWILKKQLKNGYQLLV